MCGREGGRANSHAWKLQRQQQQGRVAVARATRVQRVDTRLLRNSEELMRLCTWLSLAAYEVRVGEGAHVSVRRDGERARGRPRAEGEDNVCALGKRRRYSTMRWGAVARESYQQAQQGSREVRFERGKVEE